MTKFVLHGGGASIKSKNNDLFYSEIIKCLPNSSTILLVYLARNEDLWNKLYQEDNRKFSSLSNRQKFHFEIADKKINIFAQQIKSSEAIYIRGGDVTILKSSMKKIKNLKNLIKDKIIAGSSAGVCVFAKYFYSNDYNKIEEGLGILPMKVYCHYNENKKDCLIKLQNFKEQLDTLAIKEGEFVIIESSL